MTDLQKYQQFLQDKAIVHKASGFIVSEDEISSVPFPFQSALIRYALRKGKSAILADTGLGKCHGIDTPILMHDGSIKMVQDIKIGDKLMGPDSKPRNVLSTTKGYGDLFQVNPIKGEPFVCNDVHVLSLKCTSTKKQSKKYIKDKVVNIPLDEYLNESKLFKHFYKLYRVPISFGHSQIDYNPYFIGLWLGDGSIRNPELTINDDDTQLVEFIYKFANVNGFNVTKKEYQTNCTGYSIITGPNQKNPLRDFLTQKCVINSEKRIPREYLINNEYIRLSILAGLIDTDGYHIDNCFEIITKFDGLKDDIAFLARSLGFGVTIKQVEKSIKSLNFAGLYWKITIYGNTDKIPALLPRKQANSRKQKKDVLKTGFSVEYIGKGDYYGFTLDGDSLYLLGDFTVTHNTIMEIEFAQQVIKHTTEPALIVAPLYVAYQTIDIAKKLFGIDIKFLEDSSMVDNLLCITNYEKLHKFKQHPFNCIIFDESSIFKGLDSKTFKVAKELVKSVDYRLCCSATPAPNSIEEMGRQAEILGIMTVDEMKSTFFINRQEGKKGQRQGWQLRPHADKEGPLNFWRWLASWAMAVKLPSDLGYSDEGYILPELTIAPIFLDSGYIPEGQLFFTGLKGVSDRSQVRKRTLEPKCHKAAELALSNNEQWIVWGGLNAETDLVYKILKDQASVVNVQGSDDTDKKVSNIRSFVNGDTRILISKTKICGFGANFQNCHKMIFVGLSDSYESFYQAIKRIHRFMQDKPVQIYVILAEEEREIWENVQRKAREAEIMTSKLIENASQYQKEELDMTASKKVKYQVDTIKNDDYWIMLGDSVERMREIENSSVHLSVYSPPFEDLFVYSNTPRDLGNSGRDDFYEHYGFIVEDLLRVTKPGRRSVIHVMDLYATKASDGYRGVKDFSGDVIRLHIEKGWIYQGRIPIAKNPQAVAIRLKAHELMFATMKRDAVNLAPVQPDYLLIFDKPGKNQEPVLPVDNNEMTNETWIEWAGNTWVNTDFTRLNGDISEEDFINVAKQVWEQYKEHKAIIWDDIRETEVLAHKLAGGKRASEDDTKHVCPLQLEPVERAIKLWTNPGETVLDPFMGSGTTVYQAVMFGRYGIGIELKPEYFYNLAVKNIEEAIVKSKQEDMFSLMGIEV